MHGRRPERQDREQESLTRIAIVNSDRCKPKKCNQECKRSWFVLLKFFFFVFLIFFF
jgi:ATP-binding cassette subfamily E protein 1